MSVSKTIGLGRFMSSRCGIAVRWRWTPWSRSVLVLGWLPRVGTVHVTTRVWRVGVVRRLRRSVLVVKGTWESLGWGDSDRS